MPTISIFLGMVIQMYWRDHPPPHFHALYQGYRASIAIESGEIIEGELPRAARRLLKEWALRHRAELLMNWERGRMGKTFLAIQGADEDD